MSSARVRFSEPEREEQHSRDELPEERLVPPQQTESFKMDNSGKNWFQNQFYRQMDQDYDAQESELVVAVAAAAFAVNSVQEAEADRRRKMKEDLERSKSRMETITETDTIGSARATRSFTGKEEKDAGEGNDFPSRKPGPSTSFSDRNPADQRHSIRSDVKETKVDSWEKAQLQKIQKRYEKTKSDIFYWENARKKKARLHMERKKSELELRKTRNSQHYQDKLARFEMIARGAIAQVEDKRRKEESEVKEKAKYMRTKGRTPVRCFCC